MQLLRDIIGSLDADLTEHVKWNAPSYVFDGEDRITMNLRNKQGLVKLVLHMGATRPEDRKGAPVLLADEGIVESATTPNWIAISMVCAPSTSSLAGISRGRRASSARGEHRRRGAVDLTALMLARRSTLSP